MAGMITEIQRFSLNDGPGIRTTVFLKGCNMECLWCHNPETISTNREIHYYENNCIGCYKCVTVCPSKAHKRIGGGHRYFPKLCITCGKCADICYASAMVMSGMVMETGAIMREILQDKAYYAGSGGGLTISGGEVFCQLPLAMELVTACGREDVPVAVETNLAFPFDYMQPLIQKLQLVMCDLKLMDGGLHKKYTGADNALIVDNIHRLSACGVPFIVRTPLVPGITDTEQNISSIAEFLQGLSGLQYYELLNFNPLGASKYKSLGKPNPFQDVRPLPEKRVQELAALAGKAGVPVRCE
ncbi:MAG: glycyl-radical enzyme activating protein [Spirochaetales bacterium]|jgi:pyruvate formate lyase activating enzyme|nr:glycyl-radical enzyme activating protein [Spirochaetales bacterium]